MNFLTKKMAGLPLWAWGGILLAGVGLGVFILKKQSSNNQAAQNTAQSPAQQTLQDTSPPAAEQIPNTTGDQVYIVQPPTPVNGTGGTTTTTPATTYTIRQPGKAPGYDQKYSGVPIRSTPGGTEIGKVPWGATVTATGESATGPENVQNGSTIWYPINYNGLLGYVSAWDTVGTGQGGPIMSRYRQYSAVTALGEL